MRLKTEPYENQHPYEFDIAPVNYVYETGDVLSTGSSELIDLFAAFILKDKVATGGYFLNTNAEKEWWWGCWFRSWNPTKVYPVSGSTGTHKIFKWTDGTNDLGWVRINPLSQKLELYVLGVLVGTGNTVINPLAIYHVQVHLQSTIGGVGGLLQVRVNSVDDIIYVGVNNAGVLAAQLFLMGPGVVAGDVAADDAHWFDDFWLNDSSNADLQGDNTWGGQIWMTCQLPNAPGTYTGFTSGTMSANWQNVAQLVDQGDLTYNYSQNPGNQDSFPLQVGLPANILPKAVTVRAVAKTSATDKMALGLRVGGVDYFRPQVAAPVGNYSDLAASGRWVNDPSTNSPWTLAHINTAGYEQIIYKHTSA